MFEEQEVCRAVESGVGNARWGRVGHPGVEHLEWGRPAAPCVRCQLADWHSQPGAVAGEVQQAVQFQVEQFAHAHAGGA